MAVDGIADTSPPPASPKPPARPHPEGNIKDTVESILVAFILAFIFRAFVVEAFVIPTGSMAPTLLGAHMRFQCDDCGYDFAVNYPTDKSGGDLTVPPISRDISTPIYCPNCGYSIQHRNAVPVHYGDRILVLKYRYLFGGPKRWDVVVFKSPDKVPGAPDFTTNYIKRLIGKPGESVMILNGDIYVSTAAAPAPDANDEAFREFLKTFRVQRKPAYAQDKLWRNVFDNDFQTHLDPSIRGRSWKQPWEANEGAGWDVGQNLPEQAKGRTRVFRFNNGTAAGTLEFNAEANRPEGAGHAFADFIAYDQYNRISDLREYDENQELRRGGHNTVSDLRLTCLYGRTSGDGPLDLTLTKREDRFVAQLSPGKVSLARYDHGSGRLVKQYDAVAVPELAVGASAVRVDFANVDYRVSIRLNGREVLATGDEYDMAGADIVKLERNEEDPRPVVRISAERQQCSLEHVALARDIYYLNSRNNGSGNSIVRGGPTQNQVVTLLADEYFVCGDNSLISGDARMWKFPVELPGEDLPYVGPGRVPARFMIGKAFFVYWPAGHRPLGMDWGVVPNFGEMRFIH